MGLPERNSQQFPVQHKRRTIAEWTNRWLNGTIDQPETNSLLHFHSSWLWVEWFCSGFIKVLTQNWSRLAIIPSIHAVLLFKRLAQSFGIRQNYSSGIMLLA